MSCHAAPWYEAPVIVGGTGGSGTRGVAMLLDALGVRMACLGATSLMDDTICDLRATCNVAADCSLINSFYDASKRSLGWPDANRTALNVGKSKCNSVEPLALFESLHLAKDDLCGGSKARAYTLLRNAVWPEHRHPLRWGFKNPHSIYYVNILRSIFPCLVYVNTVRDLSEMVRTRSHFQHRVHEAVRFGMISDAEADAFLAGDRVRSGPHTPVELLRVNDFYVTFVRSINLRLLDWSAQCMPAHAVVHVPLQRMVALAARTPACAETVVHSLANALKMNLAWTMNVTMTFALKSIPLVTASLSEAHRKVPDIHLSNPASIFWPVGPLLPMACNVSEQLFTLD